MPKCPTCQTDSVVFIEEIPAVLHIPQREQWGCIPCAVPFYVVKLEERGDETRRADQARSTA